MFIEKRQEVNQKSFIISKDDNLTEIQLDPTNCVPKNKIGFMKTHKTGSR